MHSLITSDKGQGDDQCLWVQMSVDMQVAHCGLVARCLVSEGVALANKQWCWWISSEADNYLNIYLAGLLKSDSLSIFRNIHNGPVKSDKARVAVHLPLLMGLHLLLRERRPQAGWGPRPRQPQPLGPVRHTPHTSPHPPQVKQTSFESKAWHWLGSLRNKCINFICTYHVKTPF